MKFERRTLENCADATGIVVVIDVIRAFTTAAFAIEAGARSITLCGTVEEALNLGRTYSSSFVMGEEGGLPPQGFDAGNSPHALKGMNLSNRSVVQRTSAGTQGIILSKNARILLASSFVVASATVEFIKSISPRTVTFVITGKRQDGSGDEDEACADYLEELLAGHSPDPSSFIRRVVQSESSVTLFADPGKPDFLWEDIECCTDLDRYTFAMKVENTNDLPILRPIHLSEKRR